MKSKFFDTWYSGIAAFFICCVTRGQERVDVNDATSNYANTIECATTHYPPFTSFTDDIPSGYDTEIVIKLAKALNFNVKIYNVPWGRLKQSISQGVFDCFFSLAYEDERAKYLQYLSAPTHITKYSIFSLNAMALSERNLTGKIIGLHRGIPLPGELIKKLNLKERNIFYFTSESELIGALVMQRIDAFITNNIVGRFYLSELNQQKLVFESEITGYELPVFITFKGGAVGPDEANRALGKILMEIESKKKLH